MEWIDLVNRYEMKRWTVSGNRRNWSVRWPLRAIFYPSTTRDWTSSRSTIFVFLPSVHSNLRFRCTHVRLDATSRIIRSDGLFLSGLLLDHRSNGDRGGNSSRSSALDRRRCAQAVSTDQDELLIAVNDVYFCYLDVFFVFIFFVFYWWK